MARFVAEISDKPLRRKNGPGRPFKPGTSGNPGGRPKEFPEFRAMVREQGAPRAFATLMAAIEEGDVRACEVVLAYAWGKPTQAVEVTGKDGKPLGLSDDERAARLAALLDAARARRTG